MHDGGRHPATGFAVELSVDDRLVAMLMMIPTLFLEELGQLIEEFVHSAKIVAPRP